MKGEFTRELLALEAATSFKSLRVQSVLSKLFLGRGAPKHLRSDNGSEFISRSLAVFLSQSGTKSRFIKPGSPWQNGHAESFVSTLRRDCLDVDVFHNLADAQARLGIYRVLLVGLSIASLFGFCSLLYAVLSEAWLLGISLLVGSLFVPAILCLLMVYRAKKLSNRTCNSVFRALIYRGSVGNIHSFDFRCKGYARAFVRANRLKLVNASVTVSQIVRDLPVSENQVARRLTKRLR